MLDGENQVGQFTLAISLTDGAGIWQLVPNQPTRAHQSILIRYQTDQPKLMFALLNTQADLVQDKPQPKDMPNYLLLVLKVPVSVSDIP